ncbi:hypothetical protein P152DRAFT_482383 [Eremomyces bilateralis CBS 781.70]|uniref:Concanavalin A-like lectin/glucanase n=1 Tax=Eremomyces bilateralis CBS 781.70 TaxID=1392243 RepID=A0A6G1G355_9PEZI|nr:uncharacterized protein P152DRAFT_482383 [Eremomyces bilateralis CBS 781.70]KAF1812361.1 hypothetical protein P152DRAFT_482383 [Eremomyces bilateralis CBS 781.70]
MKFINLLSAVAASASLASAQKAVADTEIPAGARIEPRLETQEIIDGAQRTTINYGPYQIPPNGMLSKPTLRAETPCKDCFVTAIQANILYLDGKVANVNTGAWLHHMVITSGISPIFASGNERTPLRVNGKYKYGIELDARSSFMFITDLMSLSSETQTVNMAITYEWIPKARATGYRDVYMKWNDVGQPNAREGQYSFKSRESAVTVSGRLLYTNGHVHDGGTHTILYVDGKEACKSVMLYGRRPGFSEAGSEGAGATETPAAGHDAGAHEHRRDLVARQGHGGHAGSLHISDSSTCVDFGDVRSGQKMHVEAFYDSDKYPLMEHNGEKEKLMGIMRVYVGS